MPCYATGSAEGDANLSAREAHEETTRVTRVACELLETLRSKMLFCEKDLTKETQRWIKTHDKIDAERTEATKKARIRKQALAKLENYEREALGL